MFDAGPPYLATYSFTIVWLSGLAYPGYQPLGTIIPVAFPFPTTEVNEAPWSGPAAQMNILGLKCCCSNACIKAATVGTSVEPSSTACAPLAATWSAAGL